MMLRVISMLAVLGACVSMDEPELSDVESMAIGGGSCPSWACGTNSPYIDSHGFHDLNTEGLVNATGFAITGASKGFGSYKVSVVGGRMFAEPTYPWMSRLSGQGLVGLTLRIAYRGQPAYLIRVHEVGSVPFWAKNIYGNTPNAETYALSWSEDNGNPPRWDNVCSNPDQAKEEVGYQYSAYMKREHTVVFEDDRVLERTKRVLEPTEPGWFNLGCAGHALAKLHLTGHTAGAARHRFTTTVSERQTMLKLLTADYCGTGEVFTVAGQPLQWEAADGSITGIKSSYPKLEARWRSTGAACLDLPRLHATSGSEYPDLITGIKTACGGELPPACANANPIATGAGQYSFAFDGAYLISANP